VAPSARAHHAAHREHDAADSAAEVVLDNLRRFRSGRADGRLVDRARGY
jgi:hypothetical protein